MAKNWVQGGVLSMGTRQQVSAAVCLSKEGNSKEEGGQCPATPCFQTSCIVSLLFYQVRVRKDLLALNGSPGDRGKDR